MRWRDVRFEKPTEADADSDRYIFQKLTGGRYTAWHWDSLADCIAWCPTSELPAFDPIPDPPEGWKFVVEGDAFDFRCQVWDASINQYRPRNYPRLPLTAGNVYIVPIDPPAPPEPQYRPFANAKEFAPHRDRWWRYESDVSSRRRPPCAYDGLGIGTESWEQCFNSRLFEDGSPFGIKVEPFEP